MYPRRRPGLSWLPSGRCRRCPPGVCSPLCYVSGLVERLICAAYLGEDCDADGASRLQTAVGFSIEPVQTIMPTGKPRGDLPLAGAVLLGVV